MDDQHVARGTPQELLESVFVRHRRQVSRQNQHIAAGCRGRVRQVADVTIAQLVRAVRDGGHDVLILPADLPAMADEDTFEELLRSASCDVLIVH